MRIFLPPTIGAVAALFVLMPAALAQEAQATAGVEAVAKLAKLIRWEGVVASVVVIAATILVLHFLNRLVARLGEMFTERRLLFQQLKAAFNFVVYLVVIITVVLLSFEISREILALLGGTAAVAIGFAMKDLVASVVAGLMIMADRPFQVGDRVSFGGKYGVITAIGLRSVKLQTLDDNTVTIPNNLFLNDISSSGNYGLLDMQVVIDFHIGIDQDVHMARDLVHEATVTSCYVHLPKPVEVLVSQVIVENYVALRLRLKAYVLDIRYEKAFETDVTLRVIEAFAEKGIQPPAILHRNFLNLAMTEGRDPALATTPV